MKNFLSVYQSAGGNVQELELRVSCCSHAKATFYASSVCNGEKKSGL